MGIPLQASRVLAFFAATCPAPAVPMAVGGMGSGLRRAMGGLYQCTAGLLPHCAALLLACAAVGCAAPQAGQAVPSVQQGAHAPEASAFTALDLPGAGGAVVPALQRGPRAQPLRYRVVVVPGSGCAGMGPVADAYFAGLLHAHVLVLHKPGTHPQARTAAGNCSPAFVQADALSAWLAHAQAAVAAAVGSAPGAATAPTPNPNVPWLLVGISEGAELLPALAASWPPGAPLAGLVMVSGSGLDPAEAGALQAQRTGHTAAWAALAAQAQAPASTVPASTTVQGRSLQYWRDLWGWRVQAPLLHGPWPLLQAWGDADALVPPAAYLQFAQRAQARPAPWCSHRFAGADHGLQTPQRDGLQLLWSWLEQWARQPSSSVCTAVPPSAASPAWAGTSAQ